MNDSNGVPSNNSDCLVKPSEHLNSAVATFFDKQFTSKSNIDYNL